MKALITFIVALLPIIGSATTLPEPCGNCFSYLQYNGEIFLDFSHASPTSCTENDIYYVTIAPESNPTATTELYSSTTFPSGIEFSWPPGDYIICFYSECNNVFASQDITQEICCVHISIGQECELPPVAHFEIASEIQLGFDLVVTTDATSSQNADFYAWEWGDFSYDVGTSPFGGHTYDGDIEFPAYVGNICLVASNECGMSRYCFEQYNFNEPCILPFEYDSPPEIIPEIAGSTLSFDLVDFVCEYGTVYFDPGDGTGEQELSGCQTISHTYEADGGPYYCCIRIDYGCYTICFCYTFHPEPQYDCWTDPLYLDCNIDGALLWSDSNDPSEHSGVSVLTNMMDDHLECNNTFDGCNSDNELNSPYEFESHEIVYVVYNPFYQTGSLNGGVTIELFPQRSSLDLDMFVYSDCQPGTGPYECLASSTRPAGNDESVILFESNVEYFYVVVDGWSGTSDNEGPFILSVTCGELCHDYEYVQCGSTITGSTFDSENNGSYYCNCENDASATAGSNYGPDNTYVLEIIEVSTVTISLDILTPGANLELYLLDECDVRECLRNSRNPGGQSETITRTLGPGQYFIVVDGFEGDKGEYELSVSGCICDHSCTSSTTLLLENFESYNDGDSIPPANSATWMYGGLGLQDNFDGSIAAYVEDRNGDNKLILNYGNYEFSDVSYGLPADTTGEVSLTFDLTTQYVAGDLYNGVIIFNEVSLLLDYYEDIRILFGHDQNGNYAKLYKYSWSIWGFADSVQLATLTPLIDIAPGTDFKTFDVELVLDLNSDVLVLHVDDVCVYRGSPFLSYDGGLIGRNIEFASREAQSYMEIDNIRYGRCSDCVEPPQYDCEYVICTYVGAGEGFVEMEFTTEEIADEAIQGWEVIDETASDTIALIDGYWSGFIPGRTYWICVVYVDGDGCIRRCCRRVFIPLNCVTFSPVYSGTGEDLQFTMGTEGTGLIPISFTNTATGEQNSTGIFDFTTPGQYLICCLYFNPATGAYTVCCRWICVDYPWPCVDLFNYQITPVTGGYRVDFTSNVQDAESYEWSFDNGNTATTDEPEVSYVFTVPGTYTCCLTIYHPCRGICTWCFDITIGDPLLISVDDVCGGLNEVIDVPIQAYNFQDLRTGMLSFSLQSSGARIVGLVRGALTDVFAGTVIDDETAVMTWANNTPLSLPDGTEIATLKVEITSPNFVEAPIRITSTPAEIEFTDANFNPVPVSVDHGSVCLDAQDVTISGRLRSVSSVDIRDAVVWREGNPMISVLSDVSGRFTHSATLGNNYNIRPEKNDDPLNGVNTLDLLLILRHVAFVQRFDDPFEWLAADVNQDKRVTIVDYQILKDVLLGRSGELPGGVSWKFMPDDYVFNNAQNPLNETIPDSRTYTPVVQDVTDSDFTGIKLGDINHSASFGLPRSSGSQMRMNCQTIVVDDIEVDEGSMIDVQFKSKDFNENYGFFIEIQFDTTVLEFDNFVSSDLPDMDESALGLQHLGDGYVQLLWLPLSGNAVSLDDDSDLFTLRFETSEGGNLSDLIAVTSDNLNTHILDANFAEACVEIQFDGVSSSRDIWELGAQLTAYPNPFDDELNLAIESETSGTGVLAVYDISGRIVTSRQVDLVRGLNRYVLTDNDLSESSGVLIVQIRSDEWVSQAKVTRFSDR